MLGRCDALRRHRLSVAACMVVAGLSLAPHAGAAGPRDPAPGTRIAVDIADLPDPYAEPSPANPARHVARPEGVSPRVPEGFEVTLFADGLSHARWLTVADNGDVFLAESRAGRVTLLRDDDGDGRADLIKPFITGLSRPHGMAIEDGYFYVADTEAVWRFAYRLGESAPRGQGEAVTAPGALGSGRGHWTRSLVFAPDGAHFFVAVGSRGNIAEEEPPRATIQRFRRDGGGQETWASGLRNPVGLAIQPGTGALYTVVNERDGLGDRLVPDYLTRVEKGAFYGWPYAWLGPNPQPDFAERRPDLVARTVTPDLLFRAHSAPLGLAFYDGGQFPADYRGDAFVALHGSWNAATPRGYTVVRAPFEDGRPVGHYEVFMSGFWIAGRDTAQVWGRPVGVAVAPDGSLLVADDVGQTVWRVRHRGD